ncbi:MAG: hypothetical protein J7K68_02610 [Candidatus Diapherotrites archaeon]|nr:hypothetical protein [Candidatus Diapherotrites archaeon]
MTRSTKVKKAFDEFTEEYDTFMLETRHTNAKKRVLEKLRNRIREKIFQKAIEKEKKKI